MRFRGLQQVVGGWLLVLVVPLAVGGGGCTLDDGEPWGVVEGRLTVPAPPASEAVVIDAGRIEVRTVRLVRQTTAGGGGDATFDPANPPPGYSLCHGGHCHADSGELVAYDDIRAQLATGQVTNEDVVANLFPTEGVALGEPTWLGEAAVAEAGGVDRVEVELDSVVLEGTIAWNSQQLPVVVSLGGLTLEAPAALAFGPDAPQIQTLAMQVGWPDGLWQGVDPTTLTGQDRVLIAATENRDAYDAIKQRLEDRASLVVE